jgi:type III secretory pathway component EscT
MTPLLLIALLGFVALRYVARGANDVELFVLSGVVTSLLVGLRLLLWRTR